MNTRTAVTAAELFVLLDREFRRRKLRDCPDCYVQIPYRVDARGDAANWEVVTPPGCTNGCAAALEDLVAEYQALYELKTDQKRG